MRFLKLIICLLFFHDSLSAQEMWGISNSNFSGNMGIFLNPSIIIGAPYQYEINLAALDQFAENTFLFLPLNQKIIKLALTNNVRDKKNYLTNRSGLQNGFSHELVIGPSYIHNKTQSGWGVHSAFRSQLSILKIPSALAMLYLENFKTPQSFGVKYTSGPYSSAFASWLELGGTFGNIYKENEKKIIKWAATANVLIGQNGYLYEGRSFDFNSIDSSQLIIHNYNATFSHTSSENSLGFRGLGLSTTIGVTYIKNPNRGAFDCNMSNDKQRKYKYRLGFSLLDLGMIHYFNDATVYNVSNPNDYVWNGVDTINLKSFQTIDTSLLNNVGGNIQNKNFNIWLPLALSIQFDYQLRSNVFANASIVNRIHFKTNQIARGNQLNFSLRYERRRYEGALSLSLFEYKKPSVGLGLRYRFLVIGSDRILQLLRLSDAPSLDFFIGIKFQFCKKPFSKGSDCPAYFGQ